MCLLETHDTKNLFLKDLLENPFKKKEKIKKNGQKSSHPNFPLVYLIFFLSVKLSGGFTGSAIILCLFYYHLSLSVIVQIYRNTSVTPKYMYTREVIVNLVRSGMNPNLKCTYLAIPSSASYQMKEIK